MADRTIEKPTLLSLDDLMAMGSDARVEIINGELVPKATKGIVHGIIGSNIITAFTCYLHESRSGAIMMGSATYLMFSSVDSLRNAFEPSVSYIRNENVPPGWNPEKPHPGAPDLAIEIVSPTDDPEEVQWKRRTYLQKGTQQVWLVYFRLREVHQYTAEGVKIYSQPEEQIDVEALLPGMTGLTLAAIFDLPAWVNVED